VTRFPVDRKQWTRIPQYSEYEYASAAGSYIASVKYIRLLTLKIHVDSPPRSKAVAKLEYD
jgi:hypothetical protein